jgi:hypothetical protein
LSAAAVTLVGPGSAKSSGSGAKPHRTPLAKYGHGPRAVRVFIEAGYVRVMWRERGERRYRSWPDKREFRQEAKAFAEGLSDTLGRPKDAPTLSLRQLWSRYRDIEFPHLRANSKRLYESRWEKWELFIGKDALVDDVTLNDVDDFRKHLIEHGTAVNQVKEIIKVAKVVHNWGDSRELIAKNRLGKYRFKTAKESRSGNEPAEYTAAERDRMLATFSPRIGTHWRPWALLMILGHHGVRTSAALHLRWEDIDQGNGDVIWRAQCDKVGREWRQPLTHEMVSALAWARYWRDRLGYKGP